ncbi:hypothetical protein QNH14_14230 [Apirhabdus apintestini]|nr:hypothetical protein QNH14_14230 [Enterobacteriaceae bacterium CA-0114]
MKTAGEGSATHLEVSKKIAEQRSACTDWLEEKMRSPNLSAAEKKSAETWISRKLDGFNKLDAKLQKLHPDTYRSHRQELTAGMMQTLPAVSGAIGNSVAASASREASSAQIAADYIKDSQIIYDKCQQRVKSDPLTVTTNGLILIHLAYSGLASAITPAFRFCFSR